jgi:hypothetical protein
MRKKQSHVSMRRGVYLSPTAMRVAAGFLGVAALTAVAINWPDLHRYIKFETM